MTNSQNNKIKWIAIQPLTGGMYLGAEEAIGHPAEFILSFKGLTDVKYNKEGEMTSVANEYNLLEYLSQKNRLPKNGYYVMDRNMFDSAYDDTDFPIYDVNEFDVRDKLIDTDLDLVVAVPVCSGLSMVTSAKSDTKDSRNCNMLFISNFTLSTIKPKIYIFENAPTFMGPRGEELREEFEEMALKYGYSILYYKTDTKFHENCQQRPRTFVIFYKHNKNENQVPFLFDFEDKQISIVDFFNKIDNDNLTQNEPIKSSPHNYIVIDFIKNRFGKDDWKNQERINGSLMKFIIEKNLLDDLISFIENECTNYSEEVKTKTLKYINHIKYKKSLNMNYYGDDVCYFKKVFPSVQFRSIPNMLHPSGERICSTREYLSLMGMPEDFTLYGNSTNLPKIGQNVPVKTAKFIVEQAIKHLNNWNDERGTETNVKFQDNIKKKIIF